jgi:23S rRNA (guanine745-N1)-methyltransferase
MGSVDGVILDVGAGTGYYLDALLGAMPKRLGVALDISKRAARVAARANPRASAIVADVWDRMPLRDSCAAVVTCVFAPRNADEFARVLAPAGVLVVVTPDPDHLAGIAEPLGLLAVDPRKSERLSEKLAGHFRLVSEDRVDGSMQLARAEALAAAEMGPAAAHSSHDALQTRAAQLPEPATVRLSVTVRTFRPVARWTARPECAT